MSEAERFYSMSQLCGNVERNWIHALDRRTGHTYCGFTPPEQATWADPQNIHHLRNPLARPKDCPDCLRIARERHPEMGI